jgi:ABC-type transport system involved in multi-copper enzyme maturation permease subunit
MAAASPNFLRRTFQAFHLAGPLFTKELRVASRRRRNYVLRVVYVGLLGLFTAVAWISVSTGSSAANIYQMSQAGKTIVSVIAWFQYLAVQLAAVVLMSTSISDEIYHRTIGSLLTTPISSLQIVLGKLASRLLQLAALVALSLPLLGIVRVFGGVPWDYVVAVACMTLTSAIFAGSVALFYSILFRRAWATILLTLATIFFLYVTLMMIFALLIGVIGIWAGAWQSALGISLSLNPFEAMTVATVNMIQPGTFPVGGHWCLTCLTMLASSFLVLLPAVLMVRKVAIRRIFGPVRHAPPAPPASPAPVAASAAAASRNPYVEAELAFPPGGQASPRSAVPPPVAALRPPGQRAVKGSPVLWRELRVPMLPNLTLRIVAIALSGLLVGVFVLLYGILGWLDRGGAQASFVVVYVLVGIACAAVFAATGISSEREARTLPLLLGTPLSDGHIVLAKAAGVLRRCAPVWILAALHGVVFTAVSILAPAFLFNLAILAACVTVFLTGTGLYFSARFKKTSTAVIANLAVVLFLWVVLPATLPESDVSFLANPLRQAGELTYNACHEQMSVWSNLNWASPWEPTGRLLTALGAYSALGLFCLWRAKVRLRKNLFQG